MNIKVKNGSSIYKLATMWGNDRLPSDFCSLARHVTFNFALVSVGVVVVASYLGFLLASIAASVAAGFLIWTVPIIMLAVAILFFAALALIALVYWVFEIQKEENPNGVVANVINAYSGWKNKYCPRVDLSE